MKRNHDLGVGYSIKRYRNVTRLQGLDGLRALAIIGVTLFHMFPEQVPGGYMGVSLFFVLTGFLLAYTTGKEWMDGKFNLVRYYVKRIKRIYPSMVLMLLVSAGVFYFYAPDVIAAIRPEAESVLLGYNNWWQLEQNADYFTRIANASPFTHLWFMGIEMQYYAAWPLIFLLFAGISSIFGKKIGVVVLGVIGLITAGLMPLMYIQGVDITRLYYGTDTRVYALLLGATLGLAKAFSAEKSGARSGSNAISYFAFVVFLGMTIASYMFLDGQNSITYQGGMLVMTLMFCVMLILVVDKGMVLGELLDTPLLKWIGKKSYGIFLWQYPVIFFFSHMGWNTIAYYPVLELLIILLLTIWSDAVSETIIWLKLPYSWQGVAKAQCAVFLMVTLVGCSIAAFGFKGVAESAAAKEDIISELQMRLQKEADELERHNQEAYELAKKQQMEQVNLNGIACIGDSVMLGSANSIRKVLPGCYIDAAVSRYVGDGLEAAQLMDEQGRLGNVVIIALGTNGPIAGGERYEEQTKALLDYLGPNRQIFWVNVYAPHVKWQNTNNAYIAKMAAEHSNVHLIDWYGLISQHPEWLSKDGVHPDDAGIVQYAQLLRNRVAETLAEQELAEKGTIPEQE
ncbi:acyltransferase family protein [uncultured Anaerovibrio sp.]|uniref:acyltransferase family protein n=1 Tax=uncultured Anaerovibrio sp. TaxID=361586 RepID=UPI0025FC19C7|nr:acyltransferase family protein [uncultured Anaerovibrio sp.]